ncbi:hypothetical protein Kisp01_42290 [Kineosporia sp. NBRC 101677]|nr:hypothetical protein Kisp01_42290 [Kineosporia sp. NBRC 101677]
MAGGSLLAWLIRGGGRLAVYLADLRARRAYTTLLHGGSGPASSHWTAGLPSAASPRWGRAAEWAPSPIARCLPVRLRVGGGSECPSAWVGGGVGVFVRLG